MRQIAMLIMRLMPMLFGFSLVATTILSLTPTTAVPDLFIFWDKAQHALSFTALGVIGCLAYKKKERVICSGLIIYGAIIEIMQATLTTTRYGDPLDWIADGAGVVTGIVIYKIVQKFSVMAGNLYFKSEDVLKG